MLDLVLFFCGKYRDRNFKMRKKWYKEVVKTSSMGRLLFCLCQSHFYFIFKRLTFCFVFLL